MIPAGTRCRKAENRPAGGRLRKIREKRGLAAAAGCPVLLLFARQNEMLSRRRHGDGAMVAVQAGADVPSAAKHCSFRDSNYGFFTASWGAARRTISRSRINRGGMCVSPFRSRSACRSQR